jgi:hypothetical protein
MTPGRVVVARPRFSLRSLVPSEADVAAGVKHGLPMHKAVGLSWRNQVGKGYLMSHELHAELKHSGALDSALRKLRASGTRCTPPCWIEFGEPGMGDYAGVLQGGRYLEIEVKKPGKRPGKHQLDRLEAVRLAGGLAFWVTDIDTLWRELDAVA